MLRFCLNNSALNTTPLSNFKQFNIINVTLMKTFKNCMLSLKLAVNEYVPSSEGLHRGDVFLE